MSRGTQRAQTNPDPHRGLHLRVKCWPRGRLHSQSSNSRPLVKRWSEVTTTPTTLGLSSKIINGEGKISLQITPLVLIEQNCINYLFWICSGPNISNSWWGYVDDIIQRSSFGYVLDQTYSQSISFCKFQFWWQRMVYYIAPSFSSLPLLLGLPSLFFK